MNKLIQFYIVQVSKFYSLIKINIKMYNKINKKILANKINFNYFVLEK